VQAETKFYCCAHCARADREVSAVGHPR
jgi:hypothetical protein